MKIGHFILSGAMIAAGISGSSGSAMHSIPIAIHTTHTIMDAIHIHTLIP